MIEILAGLLEFFGSAARRAITADSDVDIAVGLASGASLTVREIGELLSRLEGAAGRPDLDFKPIQDLACAAP